MAGERDPLHAKHDDDQPTEEPETRGLEERNEATWAGPGEEPRDVHQAGGGTVGEDQGGAHTGRYGPAPAKVTSGRERKPRGQDAESHER